MKRYFGWFLLLALLSVRHAMGQDCDMPLRVVVPEQIEALDATSEAQIRNKLRQIALRNGIVGSSECSPFAITALVDVLDKEIIPGSPTKTIYVLNVNLFIVDTHDQKIYSSATVEVRCAGNSDTKAYINGIKQLSPSNKEVQLCIETGKQKMLAYYDRNYQTIIKRANTMAGMKRYEEALFNIMSIPECCVGYDAAMKQALNIYQKYVDQLCVENLAKAKMAWAAEQNADGAVAAGEYLAYIYPDAGCYGEAMSLYKEIKAKVLDDWKFEIRKYDDSVSIEEQRIKAIRDIGVAYGNGQQPTTTNLMWLK